MRASSGQSMMSHPTFIMIAARTGVGNRFDQRPEAQSEEQEEERTQSAGHGCRAAGADVHDRSHRGARARQAAEHSGDHVADALADQFAVRVMARARQRVGYQRCQEGCRPTPAARGSGPAGTPAAGSPRSADRILSVGSPAGTGPRAGAPLNHRMPTAEPRTRASRGPGKYRESRRGPKEAGRQGYGADGDRAQVRTRRGFRHRANGAQRSTSRRRGAEERQDLDQDDDDADSGHETGDDDVRRVRHETADPR